MGTNMRNMSIIMLGVAVLLGVFAVVGVRALILNSSQQAAETQSEQMVVMSSIVVANVQMEFGAEITADMIREIPWAAEHHPEGSFQSVNEILSDEGRVVLRAIGPGQLVLADQISGAGERATLSQFISQDMRAVSIRINEVSGAAGFILPGDYVDVLLTVDADNDPRQAATHVILQSVRVLAMDQVSDGGGQGGSLVARVATLEVGIEDGQRIALASSVGTLSLALRNVVSAVQGLGSPVRTIRFNDLEQNQPIEENTESLAPRNSEYTMMVVTRELESSNERVIRDENRGMSGPSLGVSIDGAP